MKYMQSPSLSPVYLCRSFLPACLMILSLLIGVQKTSKTANCDDHWKAGIARTKITPDELMWMSGYGSRNRPAEGKLTDLWAKAIALEDRNGNRGVLLTLDLVGIGRKMSVAICKKIEAKIGLRREQIALCVSHTHTGPALVDNLVPLHYLVVDRQQKKRIESYSKILQEKIVATAVKAVANLKPAQLSWGSGNATFAVNRRNNSESAVPDLIKLGKLRGPVDHSVPVLAVRNSEGALTAVIFGYACHATTLSFYQWSGDYPGFAQIELEKQIPGCQAMFWAGCGADQNPLPRRTVELAKQYGSRLAAAVQRVLVNPMPSISSDLQVNYREIDLPFSTLPTKKQIQEDAVSKNRFTAARARLLLESLEKGELDQSYPYPIQSWELGNSIQMVFLGGEVVVDYAIRIKSELRSRRTWVVGYANDVMAYIASRRILKEGGYEGAGAMVYYGLPTTWSVKSEEQIIKQVHQQLVK